MRKNYESISVSIIGYIIPTLIVVVPLTVLLSYFSGLIIKVPSSLMLSFLAANAVMGILIAIIVASKNYIKIVRPSKEITKSINKILNEGDLSSRLKSRANGEIGEITKSFNLFMDYMQQVMRNINNTSNVLNVSSIKLTESAGDLEAASKITNIKTQAMNITVGVITSEIEGNALTLNESNNNIKDTVTSISNLSNTALKQAYEVEEVSRMVVQVSNIVTGVYDNISTVSDSANDVYKSVNSVADSVKEINYSLNDISKNCERSTRITAEAELNAENTKMIMDKLTGSSKHIIKIISVINNIADQTNMLALNAAIEAAGAGEAGKGFAVVANEVKELAKQTAEATEEVSKQIENMYENLNEAVKANNAINDVIREITVITSTIACAVTEQSAITGDISKAFTRGVEKSAGITKDIEKVVVNIHSALSNVNQGSEGLFNIATSSKELSIFSKEISGNIENVATVIDGITRVINQISVEAKDISCNISTINEASNDATRTSIITSSSAIELSKISKELKNLLSSFKI